jgi:hypothetical protein
VSDKVQAQTSARAPLSSTVRPMSKVVTLSFAVVGIAVGFFAGSLLAVALNFRDGEEAKALTCVFGGAIAIAALFRWLGSVVLRKVDAKHVPLIGSVASSLALASVVLLFTRIK